MVKGKGARHNRPWGPKRGSRGIALPVREPRHEEEMGWLASRPGRFSRGKKTRYPLYSVCVCVCVKQPGDSRAKNVFVFMFDGDEQ
jgi:hypothetical protein